MGEGEGEGAEEGEEAGEGGDVGAGFEVGEPAELDGYGGDRVPGGAEGGEAVSWMAASGPAG